MITWLAEFMGRTRPLAELRSPELLAMMEPLQGFLADRLAVFNEVEGRDIDIIFAWGDSGLTGFSMRGDPDAVEEAKTLLGDRTEFTSLHS